MLKKNDARSIGTNKEVRGAQRIFVASVTWVKVTLQLLAEIANLYKLRSLKSELWITENLSIVFSSYL